MASDRTQYKQVLIGMVGALRTVVNSFQMVAQDAQRFSETQLGSTAQAATGTFNYSAARVERPILVKECRIIPGGALTLNATNYQTVTLNYTNDNGGAAVILAQTNTNAVLNTTSFPGNTGTWAQGTSILVPLQPNSAISNLVVPSGSQLYWSVVNTGAGGVAVPAGTAFQLLWEEV